MRFKTIVLSALAGFGTCYSALPARAQDHQHDMMVPAATQGDARLLVKFPEPMRLHTITSMRDHLLALQEIDVALSENDFDKAASIAETRLGMSSLELHGAAPHRAFHAARYAGHRDAHAPRGQPLRHRRTDGKREQRCPTCIGSARHGHATVRGVSCRLPFALNPRQMAKSPSTKVE